MSLSTGTRAHFGRNRVHGKFCNKAKVTLLQLENELAYSGERKKGCFIVPNNDARYFTDTLDCFQVTVYEKLPTIRRHKNCISRKCTRQVTQRMPNLI